MVKQNNKFTLLAILGLVLAVTASAARLYDRVIAKLNDEVILASDLADVLREKQGILHVADPVASADKDSIKALLDRTLLLGIAKRNVSVVPENEIQDQVEAMVADVRSHYLSENEFLREVREQYGSLERFKQELARRATIDYRIARVIGMRFTITDADVARFEDECRQKGIQPESYHLRRIAVVINDETSAGRSHALARVAALLRTATEEHLQFAEAAKRYSEIPGEAAMGGDLGYISVEKLAPELRVALEKLSPGQVTPPLVTGNFACIFYLEGKRGARSLLYEKRFLESREALLKEHRRKANLLLYDRRLALKIPLEYQECLRESTAADRSARQIMRPSSETSASVGIPSGKRRGLLRRLLSPGNQQ
ncbi:MAG: peptidylprolyl isomerase [Candidatus Sumerlaeaceae bacterium]|nr:peptidylprolyl isomerase [Candidatus Sumerlaeaceae bacterium]